MSSCRVSLFPGNKTVEVKRGTTVLEAASRAGFLINSLCGGQGTCGGCKVIIKSGKVSGGVSKKLSSKELGKNTVLSCIAEVEGDVTVEIPEQSLIRERGLTSSNEDRFTNLDEILRTIEFIPSPLIKKVYLELEKPSLAGNMADHQRVCAEIRKKLNISSIHTGVDIIRIIPGVLRKNDFNVTVTVGVNCDALQLIDVEGGNTVSSNYMAAVDMGTTTIVAHLIDAVTHKTVASAACFNSQVTFGREVTARMISAEKQGDEKLHQTLIGDINRLIKKLTKKGGIKSRDIYAVICAGNTPMGHFLLNLPTRNIRRTPYVSTSVDPSVLKADSVGIKISPRGLLYSLPGISGWVGSDLTAGILATGMYKSDRMSLLVDIGTNGEIIVGNKEWLMSCSASAGPCLEGASVECGMRAEEGAIEKVWISGDDINYSTIGDFSPKGICGSGIIDLVSALLQKNIINRSGKIISGPRDRLKTKDGIKSFILVKKDENNNKKAVYISEDDIENIITAKAAIFAAMKILLQRLDMKFSDIDDFYLAGAFGKHIDIDNAVNIGLIPNIPREKVKFAGNTSMIGVKIASLHRAGFEKTREIEENTTYYDLMGADDYVEEFQKAMFLPHTDIEEFERVTA